MKSRILCLLVVCSMVLTLFSCVSNHPADTSGLSKETTAETEKSTEKETEAESETTDPEATLSINKDLLSDIGQTYSEISAKRGAITLISTYQAALCYEFENGYGSYIWGREEVNYGTPNNEPPIVDADYNGEVDVDPLPIPMDDKVSNSINNIRAEDFFSDAEFPLSISDISNTDGMELVGTVVDTSIGDYPRVTAYMTIFCYNNEFTFHVYYDGDGVVEADEFIDIDKRMPLGWDLVFKDNEAESETTEPEATLSINKDLLSDIGQTYSEISAKRGAITLISTYQVALCYEFENGYGSYIWGRDEVNYGTPNNEPPIVDADYNGEVDVDPLPIPMDDKVSNSIKNIRAEDFFPNAEFPIKISDITEMQYQLTEEDSYVAPSTCTTIFLYGDDLYALISHSNKDYIDKDSIIDFSILGLNGKWWEGPPQ